MAERHPALPVIHDNRLCIDSVRDATRRIPHMADGNLSFAEPFDLFLRDCLTDETKLTIKPEHTIIIYDDAG